MHQVFHVSLVCIRFETYRNMTLSVVDNYILHYAKEIELKK